MEVILAIFVLALIGILYLASYELQKRTKKIDGLEDNVYILYESLDCIAEKETTLDPEHAEKIRKVLNLVDKKRGRVR